MNPTGTNLGRRVFVAGIGETPMGKYPQRSIQDMVTHAARAALRDAGIDSPAVQAIYMANFGGQPLASQGHIGPLVSEALGIPSVPTVRFEAACASGGVALYHAISAIRSGVHDVILVGGVEKMTHQPTGAVTEVLATAMDAEAEASTGLTFPGAFAMIAQRYFYEYRSVRQEMAQLAVQAHDNALLNPDAQLRKPIDIATVLEAPPIADPLGLYDCSLITDGAAFVVLVSESIMEHASTSPHRRTEIIGAGQGGDALTLMGKPHLTSFSATKHAVRQAYHQAGIGPKDLDFAEVHDCFTITPIITLEDIGICEPGTGGDAVAAGHTARDGRFPINPSGGLKAKGHAIGATGLSQLFEVITQLRGDAGQRQVPKADLGLTHNLGGTAATCVSIIVKGHEQ